jgi:hypothetical protein
MERGDRFAIILPVVKQVVIAEKKLTRSPPFFLLFQYFIAHFRHDRFTIFRYLSIGESHNLITMLPQMLRALFITLMHRWNLMNISVNLHNNICANNANIWVVAMKLDIGLNPEAMFD